MAKVSKPQILVTGAMKKAGAAVIAKDPGSSDEELAVRVYRAMADAEPSIPVYGTRMIRDKALLALLGEGDDRKKPES
jgi:hypothetical protein